MSTGVVGKMGAVDPKLREILVCPQCRSELLDVDRGLLCVRDALVYLVVENVPMMLVELAKKATPEEMSGHDE
jgi:uncharacterized protein YbaR (Trm112 family)